MVVVPRDFFSHLLVHAREDLYKSDKNSKKRSLLRQRKQITTTAELPEQAEARSDRGSDPQNIHTHTHTQTRTHTYNHLTSSRTWGSSAGRICYFRRMYRCRRRRRWCCRSRWGRDFPPIGARGTPGSTARCTDSSGTRGSDTWSCAAESARGRRSCSSKSYNRARARPGPPDSGWSAGCPGRGFPSSGRSSRTGETL